MSCGNEQAREGENDVQSLMPRRRPVHDKTMCQRCRAAKSIYIIRSVTFCRPCFELAVQARLVRVLHPPLLPPSHRSAQTRPPRALGDVLIALSGGAGSTSMVDIVCTRGYIGREGEVRDVKKGDKALVWSRGWAVHVDFAAVTGTSSRVDQLKRMAEERGLRFINIAAEDAFDPSLENRLRGDASMEQLPPFAVNLAERDLPLFSVQPKSTATPLESLQSFLAALPAPSRPALLEHLLDALLSLVARVIPNISHLLVGETSTREAQRVISGTSTGRGWALPLELKSARPLSLSPSSDTQNHFPSVVRIKVMKEVSLKEAALWCHGRHLETSNQRRWDGMGAAGHRDTHGKGTIASIEALTERFIAGLNVSHPATVTTINKTGDKLQFAGKGSYSPLCPICESPVDPSALQYKSRTALLSLPGKNILESSKLDDSHSSALAPLLCYACLTALTATTTSVRVNPQDKHLQLPVWVGERVMQRRTVSTEEMREELADFLIDEV